MTYSDPNQNAVLAFMRAMDQPCPDGLTDEMPPTRRALRCNLILEELDELEEALLPVDLVAAADAIADLLYVVYGCAVELGIDIGPVFDEVHRSNMQKVGGPVRADGKVLKSEGWTPSDIAGVLERQRGKG